MSSFKSNFNPPIKPYKRHTDDDDQFTCNLCNKTVYKDLNPVYLSDGTVHLPCYVKQVVRKELRLNKK